MSGYRYTPVLHSFLAILVITAASTSGTPATSPQAGPAFSANPLHGLLLAEEIEECSDSNGDGECDTEGSAE